MRRHLLFVSVCAAWAASHLPGALGSREDSPDSLVTLYARDDLRSSFDFRSGREGGRIVAGEIVLDDAQLIYDVFQEGMLTYGFVRDERVEVLDLGPAYVAPFERAADHAPKFSVSLFHTLSLDRSQMSYMEPGGKVRRHGDADAIFGTLPPEGLYHLEPQVGHTYLLRAKRKGIGGDDCLAKFQVVHIDPGASLTLRWGRIN